MDSPDQHLDYKELAQRINDWSKSLGFQQLGITDTLMDAHEARLMDWLNDGYHGEMDYMVKHGTKRSRPAELVDGTLRVISVRMDYFPPDAASIETVLHDPTRGFISRYALGRDYHKLMRKRLQKYADRIACSSTVRRCWKNHWRKKPGWAGSASTPT